VKKIQRQNNRTNTEFDSPSSPPLDVDALGDVVRVEVPVREALAERTVVVALSNHDSHLLQRHSEFFQNLELTLVAEDKVVFGELKWSRRVFGWGEGGGRGEAVDGIVSKLREINT
jgi:hypothetical protein